MAELILYSLIGGFFSLIGGVFLLFRPNLTKKIMIPLLSFGAGAFLAAAFLDILPEALEVAPDPHSVLIPALVGFLLFFILERLLMRFTKSAHDPLNHDHSDHTESLPYLLISGDTLHNFLDGIIIALAYTANPALGLPTALAIAAHEIPQEIGDFSILLHLKWPKFKIVMVNLLSSLATTPGVVIGYLLGLTITPHLPAFLGTTAGIFLYIAASDLIPELHHHSGHLHFFRVVLPMLASILLVGFLVSLSH